MRFQKETSRGEKGAKEGEDDGTRHRTKFCPCEFLPDSQSVSQNKGVDGGYAGR